MILIKRVFVMMSGGVDSSVAAFLLAKNKKYEVVGCFIKGYNVDGCREADAEDARRVAGFLKIPFYAIDLEKEYKKLVVDYMINGYKKGITPNPDVMCNKEIKFGLFLEKALGMGADYVATGHYVRLIKRKKFIPSTRFAPSSDSSRLSSPTDSDCGRRPCSVGCGVSENKIFSLYQAKDKNKDQSYFLWTLTQKQLKHCLFPIGDYLKSEVREIARKAGLPTAEKKDSQGICFLGMVKFKDFLKQYLPVKKGDVLGVDNKKIGEHDGAWFYTIGQRHIGSNFQFPISNLLKNRKPLYVVEKDIKKNILTVAEGENNPALYKNEIYLQNVNFINQQLTTDDQQLVYVRVRYRQPLIKARIMNNESRIKDRPIIHNSKFIIQFEAPIKFVAPGQSAAFYNSKGEMLGGGIII